MSKNLTEYAMQEKRSSAYGQRGRFRALERYAIQRRLRAAYRLMDLLDDQEGTREQAVLELGCGYFGNNLRVLSAEFPGIQFTGIDVAVDELNRERITLIQADFRTWTPGRTYDAVLSLAVVEHLVDPTAHFALIAECLGRGGLAGLTTPTPQAHVPLSLLAKAGIFDKEAIADHQNYLTETGLRTLAARTALHVMEYKTFTWGFNQWMLLRKP